MSVLVRKANPNGTEIRAYVEDNGDVVFASDEDTPGVVHVLRVPAAFVQQVAYVLKENPPKEEPCAVH